MGSQLPYAADAESPLKPEELQVLRSQYEKEGEHVGIQTKFNFAWGLIKSNARNDQQEGVRLLSDIFHKEPNNLQADSLRGLIDDKVAKEGLMGVAILSGVAIAAGVVGGMIFKGMGNRKR
ncbi:putative Mitochondria fission 1 protein [Glarea lozoyensis 74030]|uniref:Mitochondrial fission 1 protein n=1 Tax=Glarea lozoyensis (strain ATCC 74030 / MF5533) TaxID=1104152 RepID=H0EEQ4_GLAL7|nr:putative Mitochondria fission 1 protein [Glarea lozoyensis 74030]